MNRGQRSHMKLAAWPHSAPKSQLQASAPPLLRHHSQQNPLSLGISLGALETDLGSQGEPWANSIPSLSPKWLICKVGCTYRIELSRVWCDHPRGVLVQLILVTAISDHHLAHRDALPSRERYLSKSHPVSEPQCPLLKNTQPPPPQNYWEDQPRSI